MDEQTMEVTQDLTSSISDGMTLDSSVKITLDLGEILAEINENYPSVTVGQTGSIVDTYDKLPQQGEDGELYIVKEDINNSNLSSLYLYYNNTYKAVGNIFVAPIDDNSTSNIETWSAQKINSQLTNINQQVTTQTAAQVVQTQQLNSLNTIVGDLNNATTQQNYTKLGASLIDAVHDIKNSLSNISGGGISMSGVTKSVNSIGTSTNPDYFEIDYDHQNYTKLPNVNVLKLTSDVSNTKITETFDTTTNNYENVDSNILTIDGAKISKNTSLIFDINNLDSETINALTFAKYKIPNYVDTITSFLGSSYFKSIQFSSNNVVFAIKADNTLWTWGNFNNGQLGYNPSLGYSYTPTQILTDVKSIQINNSDQYIFAIKNDNTLWSWGRNNYGQLGYNPSLGYSYTPTQVLTNVQSVQFNGNSGVFALKNDGTVWTWGSNIDGQLGFSTNATTSHTSNYTPAQVLADVKSIQAYYNRIFAIKTDSTLWSWGSNIYGILGSSRNASTSDSINYAPTQVLPNVQSLQVYGYCAFAIKTDGTLWTWGSNLCGCLAFATNANTSAQSINYTPTQVLTNVQSIISGYNNYSFYAIKTDGTLWSWGSNQYGILGFATNASTSNSANYIPTQILTNVKSVQANMFSYVVYAIKTDGTLWSWGDNIRGQLGFATNAGTTDSINYTPTQILTNVQSVQFNNNAGIFALKADNTLWSWGNNAYGMLGYNPLLGYSYTPTQILTNVQLVQTNGYGIYVIKTDKTLWTWGNNQYGMLGFSTNASTSNSTNYIPTQILTNVQLVQTNSYGIYALKNDGTLWSWGSNQYGQLGFSTNASTAQSINYIPQIINAFNSIMNFLIKTNNKYYCQNNGVLEEITDLTTISDKINNFSITDFSLLNNLINNNSIEIMFNFINYVVINCNASLKNTIAEVKEYDLSSFGSFSSLIFNLAASNVKLLLSNDSGATWNTFDGTNIFSVDITDLSAIYQKGIDYTLINVLNNNSVIANFIKTTGKLKLAVLFYNTNSYIDNLTIACSFTGIWTKLVQNTDYTVNYSDNGVVVGITGTEYAKIAVS